MQGSQIINWLDKRHTQVPTDLENTVFEYLVIEWSEAKAGPERRSRKPENLEQPGANPEGQREPGRAGLTARGGRCCRPSTSLTPR